MHNPEIYVLPDDEIQLNMLEAASIPRLLASAAMASAAAWQSAYPVRAAAMNTAGNVVSGGNREYGLSRAYVHAEEAVLSRLLSTHPGIPLLGVGFHEDSANGDIAMPCPCGNCRDVLRQESGPDLLLVAGNHERALATRLGSFLFEDFKPADAEAILQQNGMTKALDDAGRARRRAASIYLPPALLPKVYGVALVDQNSQVFPGSLDTTAGYDAVTPGVAAVQSYRNRPSDSRRPLAPLAAIVVSGSNGFAADIAYRDRNAISELDEVLLSDMDTGSTDRTTPVYIFETDGQSSVTAAFASDTQEWLPFPFTNAALGMENAARSKLALLRDNL